MNYWIIVDDHHDGPYSGRQLVDNGLKPDTLVWTEGLTDWTPASEIAELAAMLENRPAAGGEEPEEPVSAFITPEEEPEAEASAPAGAEVEIEVVETPAAAPSCPCAETAPAPEAAPAAQPAPAQAAAEPAAAVEPCPPAYIAWSVIVTVLCCTVVGIPAIVFSSMTKSAYYRGDLERSKRYSELAQWFIIAAIVLGAVGWPFQIAFMGMF